MRNQNKINPSLNCIQHKMVGTGDALHSATCTCRLLCSALDGSAMGCSDTSRDSGRTARGQWGGWHLRPPVRRSRIARSVCSIMTMTIHTTPQKNQQQLGVYNVPLWARERKKGASRFLFMRAKRGGWAPGATDLASASVSRGQDYGRAIIGTAQAQGEGARRELGTDGKWASGP